MGSVVHEGYGGNDMKAADNTIQFLNDGKIVGTLNLNDMTFEGAVQESAKIFFDNLQIDGKTLQDRIDDLENRKYMVSKTFLETVESVVKDYMTLPDCPYMMSALAIIDEIGEMKTEETT